MRFLRYLRKLSAPEPIERASPEDYELLHTLCSVWPLGPWAQAYYLNPTRGGASKAAREIREAVEESSLAGTELYQDHIALLRRIELDAL
jgi:hypothetical protein